MRRAIALFLHALSPAGLGRNGDLLRGNVYFGQSGQTAERIAFGDDGRCQICDWGWRHSDGGWREVATVMGSYRVKNGAIEILLGTEHYRGRVVHTTMVVMKTGPQTEMVLTRSGADATPATRTSRRRR